MPLTLTPATPASLSFGSPSGGSLALAAGTTGTLGDLTGAYPASPIMYPSAFYPSQVGAILPVTVSEIALAVSSGGSLVLTPA